MICLFQRFFNQNRFSVLTIPTSEIPNWFRHQNVGASVNLQMPSHLLFSSKFMGIAVYAVYIFRQHHPLHPLHIQNDGYTTSTHGIFCFGKPNTNPCFLHQITTSLLLLTFRAYWPLSQSNEFTNSFTSNLPLIVPMGLLLHSLGFLSPFTSSLPLIILVDLSAIIPTILSCQACFTIFSPHFLHIVGLFFAIGPFVKSGHQQGFCLMKVFPIS